MFREYPYTNYNDLNLDWILRKLPEIAAKVDEWIAATDIKFADPIDWDYATTYDKSTIVRYDGDTYISKTEVNGIIPLDNPDYWVKIGDYDANIEALENRTDALEDWRENTKYQASDYGIYPDTDEDYADLIENLLNDGIGLVFDSGVYHIGRRIVAEGGCSMFGQGQNETILLFDGATAGIRVNLAFNPDNGTMMKHNAIFENLSILKDSAPSGIGIDINGYDTIRDRWSISPEIKSVRIGTYRQNTIGHGFSEGIHLSYCNGCVIDSCAIIGSPVNGLQQSFNSTYGIYINSDQDHLGTEFMITNTKITYFTDCIRALDAEGLMITACVLQSCQRGIYWVNGQYRRPHLGISNCHIRANCQCIHIANIEDSIISDNLLYYYTDRLLQNETNYGVFVQWANKQVMTVKPSRCTITGNIIREFRGPSGETNVNNPIIVGIGNVNVTDNILHALNSAEYAVWLNEDSSNCFVNDNLIAGAQKLLNQGANNICPDLITCPVTLGSGVIQQGNNTCTYGAEGLHFTGAVKVTNQINAGGTIATLGTSHGLKSLDNVAMYGTLASGFPTLVAITLSDAGVISAKSTIPANTVIVFSNMFRFN